MNKKVLLLGAALSMLLAVSAGAAGTIDVNTDNAPSYTVKYTSESAAVDQQVVLLVVEEGTNLSSGLSVDTILYIDQKGTDDKGVAEFKNFQMKTTKSADIYIGTASGTPVSKKDAIKVDGVSVTGHVKYHGDASVASVNLVDKDTQEVLYTTATGTDGNYSFEAVAPGSYELHVTKPLYLSYTKKTVTINTNDSVLPEVDMSKMGGDLNKNGVVNGPDLAALINGFNSTDADKDINGNGQVNGIDLSALITAFNERDVVVD